MAIKQRNSSSLNLIFYFVVAFTFVGVMFQWSVLRRIEIQPQTERMFVVVEPDNRLKELENLNEVEERCEPPAPDPLNEDVLPFLNIAPPPKCVLDEPKSKKLFNGVAFTLKEGRFLHRVVDLGVPCCMKNIVRNAEDDGIRNLTKKCYPITKAITKIKKNSNHIAVECKDEATGDLVYSEAFTIFHEKEKVVSSSSGPKLNVIFLGMEATSQLNFIRKMPLTYAFLRHNLNAVLLKGYNKVGECTHTNIIPLLAGVSTPQFEEECIEPQKRQNIPPKLDNCSLMWNTFAKKEYVTFFGEDYARWGPFDFYWPKTFWRQPTDYYLRPAAIYSDMLEGYYATDFSCMGPRLGFDVIMESVRMVASVNKDKPFFQFVWPGSLGYRDMNHQQRGDESLLTTLKFFQETGLLNKSVVFVVGDHGFRKRGYKFTRNGAIEDRMPIAFIALPEWFQKSYPEYYTNLKFNARVMTSHYDVHKTILDILNLDDPENGDEDYPETGTSLFKTFPSDRTCLAAGIPLLWCLPCHPRQPLENEIKLEVAGFLINMLNTGIQLCDPFVFNYQNYDIKSILFASKWDPRDVQRELCSRDGKDVLLVGYYGQSPMTLNIPCELFFNAEDKIDIVSVEFSTVVTNATFMGEVIRYKNHSDGKWHYHLTEDIQYNYINQMI